MPQWSGAQFGIYIRRALFTRLADLKLINLQRQGRCGTYPSIEGQEACQMGTSLALKRAIGFSCISRVWDLLSSWNSLENLFVLMGNNWGAIMMRASLRFRFVGSQHSMRSVMRATEKPTISVSFLAMAPRRRGVYEAMNFAGVLMCLHFYVSKYQWAISIPRKQTAAATLAQKAIVCGIPGIQTMEMMFLNTAVMNEAVERARGGKGSTFISCDLSPKHTTSDDAGNIDQKSRILEKKRSMLRLKLFCKEKFVEEAFEKKYDESQRKLCRRNCRKTLNQRRMTLIIFMQSQLCTEEQKRTFNNFIKFILKLV